MAKLISADDLIFPAGHRGMGVNSIWRNEDDLSHQAANKKLAVKLLASNCEARTKEAPSTARRCVRKRYSSESQKADTS
jgi:hypothetical protein